MEHQKDIFCYVLSHWYYINHINIHENRIARLLLDLCVLDEDKDQDHEGGEVRGFVSQV